MEKLLTINELAALLAIPRSTLYQWRYRGEGPPATKVGKHLRYSETAVSRWLESQTDQRGAA